jgi:hypothetical protein
MDYKRVNLGLRFESPQYEDVSIYLEVFGSTEVTVFDGYEQQHREVGKHT